VSTNTSTVELHLSGLLGTTTHLDKQKVGIIGFLIENRVQLAVWSGEKKSLRTAVLGYKFIYVQIKH